MGDIPQPTINEAQEHWLAIRDVASACECPPEDNCFCARNVEWAERKLAEIRQRRDAEPV